MSVGPVLGGQSAEQLASASRTVSNELGQDAFLRLLIAQLANQDPLNPMEDREFIAQMAQFTALEQMTSLNRTMENMANMNQFSAVNYVGTTVAFTLADATGQVQHNQGRVLAVWFDPREGPVLEVQNFGDVPLRMIEGVTIIT